MSRIVFEPDIPVVPADLGRTDVACFVGLVRLWAAPGGTVVPAGTPMPAGTLNVWGKLVVSAATDGPAGDVTPVHRAAGAATDGPPTLKDVHAGDLLCVLPGEIVPIDSEVAEAFRLPLVPDTRRRLAAGLRLD